MIAKANAAEWVAFCATARRKRMSALQPRAVRVVGEDGSYPLIGPVRTLAAPITTVRSDVERPRGPCGWGGTPEVRRH